MKELDIREIADLSGISPSALRYYEKRGLIKPVGRNGLRRQYHENVLNKLQLITLGQAAGFSLDDIAAMFGAKGTIAIDREQLHQQSLKIDNTIRRLQLLSRGLKHAARCTQPEHTECEEFQKIVSRGLRLVRSGSR
ncbi:helix-turn-helix domain-containing protein [Lelliottia nimipressuralis]|uniref:Helix-turn-helix domain-containing protein n=1 Tax=Lelliottia nimipressuralis TaxID=69220 RepID=A0ABY3P5Y1_9ENTR|nr:helix-turn-helix domain-containing protein [Lelliottia nimipressuralis]RXJ19352.1 MerR family transcriptional regulator [Lelliottia nimipressuralis]TYT34851.1 helix-turn-helix domain-containing protein [Lelliottia nimipressuralis]